jgi:hypothetical protein
VQQDAATQLSEDDDDDDDVGESVGRRGGAFLSTTGSFTLSSGSNTAGNDESLTLDSQVLGENDEDADDGDHVGESAGWWVGGKATAKANEKVRKLKTNKKGGSQHVKRRSKFCHEAYSLPYVKWLEPYTHYPLSADLQKLGCNPAQCDNDKGCRMKPCQVMSYQGDSLIPNGYDAAKSCKLDATTCTTLERCGLFNGRNRYHKPLPLKAESSEEKLCPKAGFDMRFPGSRVGICNNFAYSAGLVYCSPEINSHMSIYTSVPANALKNPFNLQACWKTAIGPIGSPGDGIYASANSWMYRRASFILLKRTVCMKVTKCKMKGGKHCPPKVCYAYKTGKCIMLKNNVWPTYMSRITSNEIKNAHKQYNAGQFKNCDASLLEEAGRQITGN